MVGAVPPLIGWAGATSGDLLAPEPLLLATILYLWQFPHFFALSWLHREDYARGGFQMVAVNDPSGERSARLIFKYAFYLGLTPLVSSMAGVTSYMFAVEGCLLNGYLLVLANRFHRDRSDRSAREVFKATLWYLPLLLAGFVYHNRNWEKLDSSVRSSELVVGFLRLKDRLRGWCLHEWLVLSNKEGSSGNKGLCVKLRVDEAKSSAVESSQQTLDAARVLASADSGESEGS